jgi:hypothetical protein
VKTLEFDASLNPDKTLTVPPALADQVPAGHTVRVLLLVADSDEEKNWKHLTTAEFFKGYADGDAIYDELPSG